MLLTVLETLAAVLLLVLIGVGVEAFLLIRKIRGELDGLVEEVVSTLEEVEETLDKVCLLLDNLNGSLEGMKRSLFKKSQYFSTVLGFLKNVLPIITFLGKLKRR